MEACTHRMIQRFREWEPRSDMYGPPADVHADWLPKNTRLVRKTPHIVRWQQRQGEGWKLRVLRPLHPMDCR